MVEIKHKTLSSAIASGSRLGPDSWDEEHTVPVASQLEAEAGTSEDKLMTPLRTAQAIAAMAVGGGVAWDDVTGKPATFPPEAHTQAISTVTGLQTALDGKQPLATVLTNTTAAFTTAQETKLSGVATGATANATDAALRDRATHTGTQAAATITGLADVATSGAYGDLTGAPPAFYLQETRPSADGPWQWWVTDTGGSIVNLIINDGTP